MVAVTGHSRGTPACQAKRLNVRPKMAASLAAFLLILSVPSQALACEPVAAMLILFGVPVFSLFGVILIKAFLFAWMERSSGPLKAFAAMIAANIVSSLIGLFPLLLAAAPSAMLFGLLLVFLITILPARRFIALNPWGLAKNWRGQTGGREVLQTSV